MPSSFQAPGHHWRQTWREPSHTGGDPAAGVRNAFLGLWHLVEAAPEAQLLTYELTSWAETEPGRLVDRDTASAVQTLETFADQLLALAV